ncbi:MAG: biopolymer transporter ExbD [Candidatus Omnitrophica bacterium]|nr:biopolymer transporter ExbD [Candidatus Omnitrophota bacterium]
MSLTHFKVDKNIIHPILGVSFINFVLMVVILIMSTTIFARPSGVQMEFPLFKEGAGSSGRTVQITVTGENVIYIDGRVVTLNELRHFLAQGNFMRDSLMIKADARASMGRVADILDLCRGISGASVNVSTIL